MDRHISAPLKEEDINELKMGDYVYITGTVYVARDAAHKRMMELLDEGKELPFDLKDNIIYYMGPSPAREGRPIGSAGPTTASRMDKYAPKLLDLGLKGMIAGRFWMPLSEISVYILPQWAERVPFSPRQLTAVRLWPMRILGQRP